MHCGTVWKMSRFYVKWIVTSLESSKRPSLLLKCWFHEFFSQWERISISIFHTVKGFWEIHKLTRSFCVRTELRYWIIIRPDGWVGYFASLFTQNYSMPSLWKDKRFAIKYRHFGFGLRFNDLYLKDRTRPFLYESCQRIGTKYIDRVTFLKLGYNTGIFHKSV